MTKPSPKQKVRKVKAWAFLTSDGKLIPTWDGEATIYLKKPSQMPNPFNGSEKKTWKPTQMTLSYLQ